MFGLFSLTVLRTERISPSLTRVTFGGADLAGFASGGRDQSLSLFLPHPGQEEPQLPTGVGPDEWFGAYLAMPHDVRAVMRSYTVREQRAEPAELDIDFALHADGGPACRWAERAEPGQRVAVLGPTVADNTGVRFRRPDDADWVLIWADETALPAAAASLETLPAGTKALVWIEVPFAADRIELRTEADAEVTWLVREEGAPDAADAVAAADLPSPGTGYAWIAGESGSVKALRRHLVRERAFDKKRVTFTGYWRRGVSEDLLRTEAAEED
ncbi:siderophore-interacting protein [Streptomyces sp. NPDC050504]|uniref:siderophore-interacting protein n=1 Tax=Streptomyces sp. NPDC050504 TaxID=3365618 RepID=UPI003789FD6B